MSDMWLDPRTPLTDIEQGQEQVRRLEACDAAKVRLLLDKVTQRGSIFGVRS